MAATWIDRLTGGASLDGEARERLAAIPGRERRFEPSQALRFEDDEAPLLFFVESGWAAAVRDLADGSMQILDLFLPGQVMGLREVTSTEAISSYRALTTIDVRVMRKDRMQSLIEEYPQISELVLTAIAREEAWLMERITAMGQRNAAQCLVHLMLELADRLTLQQDRESKGGFDLPLNQEQVGNIVGITPVHVSRTLKQVADDGLLVIEDGRASILDRDRCESFAGYDARRMRLVDATH